MPAPTKPLFARELPPGPLRDTLLPITDVRALLPLAQLRSRERLLSVLDDERKTVVRLALEETALLRSDGPDAALRPRLRITGIRGYDKDLGRVQEALVGELGFKPADQPLVDEAVRAAGGVPGGLPTKVGVPLQPDQRSDARRRRRAARDARGDRGEPRRHDRRPRQRVPARPRVSVRRSRSVQRELKRVFPPDELAHYRAEFRWLQQVTGDVRDLDVHVLEFDDMRALVPEAMRDDLDPLLRVLRARRVNGAPARWCERCAPSGPTTLLSAWGSFLDGLEAMPEDERPDAARPIVEVAGERIRKVYRRMLKMGGAIDAVEPGRVLPRAPQEGQGAPLPARAVRRRRSTPRRWSSR